MYIRSSCVCVQFLVNLVCYIWTLITENIYEVGEWEIELQRGKGNKQFL
jgi:hypothetical protein